MNTTMYKGIFPALLTPMHEDNSIDFTSLEVHINKLQQQRVTGFYVGGSTAEAFILSMDERKQILETTIRAASGKSTIIAHIGCISTSDCIELARHAERVGADAISAVVPFYYKTTTDELFHHYKTIMDSSKLPMIVYHFPGATGVQVPLDFYERIAEHPQCIGVKFTSLNLFEMQQIRARCGKDFLIFNGHDEVYAAGAMMGADGAIGSTFNIIAPLFVHMFDCIQRAQWHLLYDLQAEANEMISAMLAYDIIPFEKEICRLQGAFESSKARMPLKQLTSEEKSAISKLHERLPILSRA